MEKLINYGREQQDLIWFDNLSVKSHSDKKDYKRITRHIHVINKAYETLDEERFKKSDFSERLDRLLKRVNNIFLEGDFLSVISITDYIHDYYQDILSKSQTKEVERLSRFAAFNDYAKNKTLEEQDIFSIFSSEVKPKKLAGELYIEYLKTTLNQYENTETVYNTIIEDIEELNDPGSLKDLNIKKKKLKGFLKDVDNSNELLINIEQSKESLAIVLKNSIPLIFSPWVDSNKRNELAFHIVCFYIKNEQENKLSKFLSQIEVESPGITVQIINLVSDDIATDILKGYYLSKPINRLEGIESADLNELSNEFFFKNQVEGFLSLPSKKLVSKDTSNYLRRLSRENKSHKKEFNILRYFIFEKDEKLIYAFKNLSRKRKDLFLKYIFESISSISLSKNEEKAYQKRCLELLLKLNKYTVLEDQYLFKLISDNYIFLNKSALKKAIQLLPKGSGIRLTIDLYYSLKYKRSSIQKKLNEKQDELYKLDFSLYKNISEALFIEVLYIYKEHSSSYWKGDVNQVYNTFLYADTDPSIITGIYEVSEKLPKNIDQLHFLIQATLLQDDPVRFEQLKDHLADENHSILKTDIFEKYEQMHLCHRYTIDDLGLDPNMQLCSFLEYLLRVSEVDNVLRFSSDCSNQKQIKSWLEENLSMSKKEVLDVIKVLARHAERLKEIDHYFQQQKKRDKADKYHIGLEDSMSSLYLDLQSLLSCVGYLRNEQQAIALEYTLPILEEYDPKILMGSIKNYLFSVEVNQLKENLSDMLCKYVNIKALRELSKNTGVKIYGTNIELSNLQEKCIEYLSENKRINETILKLDSYFVRARQIYTKQRDDGHRLILMEGYVKGRLEDNAYKLLLKNLNSDEDILEILDSLNEDLHIKMENLSFHKANRVSAALGPQFYSLIRDIYDKSNNHIRMQLLNGLYNRNEIGLLLTILRNKEEIDDDEKNLYYKCLLGIKAKIVNSGYSTLEVEETGLILHLIEIENQIENLESHKNIDLKNYDLESMNEYNIMDYGVVLRKVERYPQLLANRSYLEFVVNSSINLDLFAAFKDYLAKITVLDNSDIEVPLILLAFATGFGDRDWTNQLIEHIEKRNDKEELAPFVNNIEQVLKNVKKSIQLASEIKYQEKNNSHAISLKESIEQIAKRYSQDFEGREYFKLSDAKSLPKNYKKELALADKDKKSIILLGVMRSVFEEISYLTDYESSTECYEFFFKMLSTIKKRQEQISQLYNQQSTTELKNLSKKEFQEKLWDIDFIFNFELDASDNDSDQISLSKHKSYAQYLPSGILLKELLLMEEDDLKQLPINLIDNSMGNLDLNKVLTFFGDSDTVSDSKIRKMLKEYKVGKEKKFSAGVDDVIDMLKACSYNLHYISDAADSHSKIKKVVSAVRANNNISESEKLTLAEAGVLYKLHNLVKSVVVNFETLIDPNLSKSYDSFKILKMGTLFDPFKFEKFSPMKLVPEDHFLEGDILLENENKYARIHRKRAWNPKALFKGKSLFECIKAIIEVVIGILGLQLFQFQTAFTGKYKHASVISKSKGKIKNFEIQGQLITSKVDFEEMLKNDHYRPNFYKIINADNIPIIQRVLSNEGQEDKNPVDYVKELFQENLKSIYENNGKGIKKLHNSGFRAFLSYFYDFPIIGFFLGLGARTGHSYKILDKPFNKQEGDVSSEEFQNREMFCSEFVAESLLAAIYLTELQLKEKVESISPDILLELNGSFLNNPIPDDIPAKSISPTRLKKYIDPYFTKITPPKIFRKMIKASELQIN